MKKIILSLSLLVYCSTIIAQDFPIINPENVQIIRDEWGVPHIFGNTDAEAAYGLAWASAEDTFEDMQELLIAGKGMMGKFQGIKGAEADFFVHVIQVDELVDRKMKEMPEDFLKYIDGYAQGINKYAKLYPSKVALKNLFPIDTRDIIKSSVVMMSFITEAGGALSKIYNGKLDEVKTGLGSNAFAINSKKSTDGNTYLCINPHLQMTGSFSFYEAHMASNEGLNISGSLFLGGISVYMGNNENLGWGMTWNHFDQGDIYKLKMHPKKKLLYEYDGKWEKLEKKKVWLKVKVAKGIVLPVAKKSYWSKLGPVINSSKEKDNFYAFKYPAFYEITAPLQVYRMNKAKNFKEFKSALDIQGLGMFNIVYADKEENIFYLSSG
ncbi:MAG: acyl-homoserine-lactone acylase, partial [Planctomycetota bacterium]